MQVKCPCCKSKISLLNILFFSNKNLANYICPNCKKNIQTPWGMIIGYQLISIGLLLILLLRILSETEAVFGLDVLFSFWIIFTLIMPFIIKYLPLHCLKKNEKKYNFNGIKINIIKKNMNIKTFNFYTKTLKSMFTIFGILLCFSIFSIEIDIGILALLVSSIFILYPIKKILSAFYVWKKYLMQTAKIKEFKIIHRVDKSYKDYGDYQLEIKYSYSVDGNNYLSDKLYLDENSTQYYSSIDEASLKLEEYLNNDIKIYYNPKNPQQSFMNIKIISKYIFLYVLFLSIGLGLLLL